MYRNRKAARFSILQLLSMALALVVTVATQAEPLFLPAPSSRSADLMPAQNQVVMQLMKQKTTQSISLIRLNLNAMKRDEVDLSLRADVSTKATKKRIDQRSDTDFTWYGQLSDVPGDAVLVINGDVLEGTIRHGTDLYKVQSVGAGLHSVIQIDQSKFPPDEPPSFKAKELKVNQMDAPAKPAAAGDAASDSSISSEVPVIEVLVAYTGAAETAKGGAASMSAMIQLAIDETNQSYQNSHINARLHLAHVDKVTYSETGKSYDTLVAELSGTSDGFMDGVHALRNTYAADVVVLIVNQSDYCGMADAIRATADTAFATVHYDCATGYYSFGHEIGHLQGARHNTEADSSTTPFTYGHGFHKASDWRTVMAYNCSPSCSRLQYWSSPSVSYGGTAMGTVAGEDNARVLSTTSTAVATFRNPDGTIWRYTGTPCAGNSCPGWQMLDNNPKTAAIAAAGTRLYQLHNNGAIWRYTGTPCTGNSCPGWQKLDNNSKTVSIVAAGTQLYQLHTDGAIWRSTGRPCVGNVCRGWQKLDNNPKAKAIVASGTKLYQLHNDGMIWVYTGTACSGNSCPGWQKLDNNPKAKAIVASGTKLYQLHNDGMIWVYTGTACTGNSCPGWQRLDNNPKTTAIVAGTKLYQLHNDGMIWVYTGTPCTGNSCPGWKRLDNNPKAQAIVAAGSKLYQLHNDGMTWVYTGPVCSGNSCPGWQRLDNNPKTKAIDAAGTALYQLHGN